MTLKKVIERTEKEGGCLNCGQGRMEGQVKGRWPRKEWGQRTVETGLRLGSRLGGERAVGLPGFVCGRLRKVLRLEVRLQFVSRKSLACVVVKGERRGKSACSDFRRESR